MGFKVGDRVLIHVPFVDGYLRSGTTYAVRNGEYPYHVLPDGELDSGAYKAEELGHESQFFICGICGWSDISTFPHSH